MGLVDWASQGFLPMEFHVHLNMLFWWQSGKVDGWKFNQGFQKAASKGLYPEKKNSQGASFKSSRASAKIDALPLTNTQTGLYLPLPPSATALCIYVSYIGLFYRELFTI